MGNRSLLIFFFLSMVKGAHWSLKRMLEASMEDLWFVRIPWTRWLSCNIRQLKFHFRRIFMW